MSGTLDGVGEENEGDESGESVGEENEGDERALHDSAYVMARDGVE